MINTTKDIQDNVHNYIQTAPEVNLTEMMAALREDGVNITRPSALKALRAEGLEPYTTTLNGSRVRLWRKATDENDANDASDDDNETDASDDDNETDATQSDDESEIERVTVKNAKLSAEKDAIWGLVQKSVELKNSIRAQQAILLREMANLIRATYGDSDE